MFDSGFFLTDEQKSRRATCYQSTEGKLMLIPQDDPFFAAITSDYGYCSGAAGSFSTLYDYDRFTTMLANGGELDGVRIITRDSIDLMRTPIRSLISNASPAALGDLALWSSSSRKNPPSKLPQEPSAGQEPLVLICL